jgi:hypothetical protein
VFHVSSHDYPGQPAAPGQPGQPGQPGGYGQPGSYPQQEGSYEQPGGYTAPPSGSYPPAAPTPPPRKSGSKVRLILTIVVIGVVVIGGIVAFIKSRSAPASTKVGDCMVGQTAEALKKIDCTDGKAEWKVVGRVGGKTEAETTVEDTCTQWPDTEVVYWEGKKGQTGFALCLAPTKK